ncbi:MAG: hypothetical protein WC485_09735 [Opitutaceae bacterium]
MTLELSLRRRATHARFLAILWLTISIGVLIGTYLSLPFVAKKALTIAGGVDSLMPADAISRLHMPIFAITMLLMGFFVIALACYLLGRTVLVEIELAARFSGLADALCVAGSDLTQFERAAAVFVPKGKYLSAPFLRSSKDLKSMAEFLRQIRP